MTIMKFKNISITLILLCFLKGTNANDTEKCGKSELEQEENLFDDYPWVDRAMYIGTNALREQLPWAVAIHRLREFVCGGTMISKKHIITAAHCFAAREIGRNCSLKDALTEEEIINDFSVHYGSICLDDGLSLKCENSENARRNFIKRAEFRRYFAEGCRKNDVALLELMYEVDDSSQHVNYICLPHRVQSDGLEDKRLISYGWEAKTAGDEQGSQNVLQMFPARADSEEECRSSRNEIPSDALCVEERNVENECTGDTGGGVIARNGDGRWVLLGVASRGHDCEGGYAALRNRFFTTLKSYGPDIDEFMGVTPALNANNHNAMLDEATNSHISKGEYPDNGDDQTMKATTPSISINATSGTKASFITAYEA